MGYSNKLYTSSSNGGYFDLVQSTNSEFVGEMVCMSCASTATNPVSCGVLKSKSASYSIEGVSFNSMRTASYVSVPGDSGAPTYYSSILKGVNKGTHNGNGAYSHVENVLTSLGMSAIIN